MDVVRETAVLRSPLSLHELVSWQNEYDLTAGITSRGGDFDDFGLTSSPTSDTIPRWLSLHERLPGQFVKTCTGRQVHGACIARHGLPSASGEWALYDNVDGHITADDGILLTVTVADCVPIFLYAPDTNELGLLHAGWRGVAANILEKGIDQLISAGAAPEKLVMHLGPSVCGDCYEVGREVADALGVRGGRTRCVDLRRILAEKANKNGVLHISSSAWCTKHDSVFHSYRRDGGASGRMVAYLGRSCRAP